MKSKKILLAPFNYGSNNPTMRLNFSNLLNNNNLNYENINFNEKDIIINDNGNLKYLDYIVRYSNEIALLTNEYSKNTIPITIGGDHSIAIGTISGISANYENLGVIWIDAHADMNTDETSITGNIHGMALSALQGLGNKQLITVFNDSIKIKTENIVIFGVRDIDDSEKVLMDTVGVKYISMNEIKEKGFEISLNETILYLKSKVKNLHISLDLDSMDPSITPGVNTPVNNGLSETQVQNLLTHLINQLNITSIDIVEYNPWFDITEKTISVIYRYIEFLLNNP